MPADGEELTDFCQRGEAIYETRLRVILDTPENDGKGLAIELESEDYEVDGDKRQAIILLRKRHPDRIMYSRRIGNDPFSRVRGGRVIKNR